MAFPIRPPGFRNQRGFSLVEVLVALSIIGLAGAALLLASETTTQVGNDAVSATIARGIAEQIADEVLGRRYVAAGESAVVLPLGPEPGEASNPLQTSRFDDSDDYHGAQMSPPMDPWGVPLGMGNGSGGFRPEDFRLPPSFFQDWVVTVTVAYVNEATPALDLSGSSVSGTRAVTVTVKRTRQGVSDQLAQVRRVFAHVAATGF